MSDILTVIHRNLARGFLAAAASLCAAADTSDAAPRTLPTPQITFQGENITNTPNPIEVAIGQKIKLDADQQGASQSWLVSAANVYGDLRINDQPPLCPDFPQISQQSCVVYKDADFSKPETIFYLPAPGTYTVTYSYFDAHGHEASSSTRFKAEGPQSVSVTSVTGIVQILPAPYCITDCQMAFYNPHVVGGFGIVMTATARDPKAFAGHFLWSQQVAKDISLGQDGQTYVCPHVYGLDNFYPAARGSTFQDGPNITLNPGQLWVREEFSAVADLLWQAKQSDYVLDSTPVTVGTVSWSWGGKAEFFQGAGWLVVDDDVPTVAFSASNPPLPVQPWNTILPNDYLPDCYPG
jgi:hypothetical protein